MLRGLFLERESIMKKRQPIGSAEYDSVADYLEAIEGGCNLKENMPTYDDAMNERKGASWYGAGCAKGTTVMRKIREGWPEGQEQVTRMLESVADIEARPVDRRRRNRRGDFGDALDIHAVYRGRLDIAWTRCVRQQQYGPQHIDIVADMQVAWHVDQSAIQWRGTAMIALADKFERAGYQVRLRYGFECQTTPGGEKARVLVTIKDYDKPIDLATSTVATIPGFFRCCGFRWVASHAKKRVSTGIAIVGTLNLKDGAILVTQKVRSKQTAVDFVNEQVKKLEPQAA